MPEVKDKSEMAAMAASIPIKEWAPKNQNVDTETGKVTTEAGDEDTIIADLTQSLKNIPAELKCKVNVVEFEKDDDTNHHVDWMWSSSALRAIV